MYSFFKKYNITIAKMRAWLIAAVVVLVLVVIFVAGAYGWYHMGPWEKRTYVGVNWKSEGDPGVPVVFDSKGKPPQNFRFRKAVFTLRSKTGDVRTYPVTGVLNEMAMGMEGSTPPVLFGLNMIPDPDTTASQGSPMWGLQFGKLDALSFNTDLMGDMPVESSYDNETNYNAALSAWRGSVLDNWVAKLDLEVRLF